MLFLPVSLMLFILFLLLIPLLFALAPAVAFAKLGLSPVCGYLFFILCLFGSSINIPVHREEVTDILPFDDVSSMFYSFLGIRLPRVSERVIAVNLGGAVFPGLLSLYLLRQVPVSTALAATAVTSLAAFMLSKPVQGVGVVMPAFVPPIISAVVAVLMAREYAPQVAYISGVMGTLIGADLLRLRQIRRLKAPFLSIGGAGVFDGIYLVGLVSVLLA
ncbi:MAG TPA: DUF1614 domain-containing protein [Nitrospirae bacterium]|nr:DUF1614 domain-containing protein [Nitrospirota bacterium]